MIKHSQLMILGVAAISLAGCAQSVSKTMSRAVASAPDWFDERREEVAGDGYPDLQQIPESPRKLKQAEKDKIADQEENLLAEADLLKNDPKAESSIESGLEDPADVAARIRNEVERGAEASQLGLVEETKLP